MNVTQMIDFLDAVENSVDFDSVYSKKYDQWFDIHELFYYIRKSLKGEEYED